MKKLWFGAVICASLLVIHSTGYAQESVKVVGKASTSVAPDTFLIRFGFEQRGISASKLKTVVDGQTTALTNYARSLGVAAEQIKSSQLSVHIRYPNPNERVNQVYAPAPQAKSTIVKTEVATTKAPMTQVEFVVSRTVEINLTNLRDYDKLLDNSVKIGATRIDPVQSLTRDNEEVYQALLKQAVANARSKAQTLVDSAGGKLGRVIALEELSHFQARPRMMAAESARFHQSYSGSDTLSAEVSVHFAIEH
ncbi:SIMPL domain-containing protein [Thalassotalea sp. LPB0316]|uniref:SIMPL domain-containing protein n=1 Tax=Thalassotalea sp. LPB0316 TaxID=2769490 RepID=UPI001866985A|nr:SIMPL domain-containing protein [Thalassotalea sp. LPB0316]QOL25002.1 SIMPL domain-containing protein [Thalassotalea sp. LPB0316]